jgi:hypothetical protein
MQQYQFLFHIHDIGELPFNDSRQMRLLNLKSKIEGFKNSDTEPEKQLS